MTFYCHKHFIKIIKILVNAGILKEKQKLVKAAYTQALKYPVRYKLSFCPPHLAQTIGGVYFNI